jgi:hypothetical protein
LSISNVFNRGKYIKVLVSLNGRSGIASRIKLLQASKIRQSNYLPINIMAQDSVPNSLTPEQIAHFEQHGWLRIPGCFSREAAAKITANVWTRLGMSPTDKETWHTERINMPKHNHFPVSEFAPKAWDGICQLVGGADRITPSSHDWGDGWIVNLGTKSGAGKKVTGNELKGWHVDGDFFVHYLDSPEQGLLIIPLFTDIIPGAGGTMLCPPAMGPVARHLFQHPEGVSPRMTPRAENPKWEPENTLDWFNNLAASYPPEEFVEATGEAGDVYLLHPLMLHSASNNALRIPRIITNPPVSLREPFQFSKDGKRPLSVVERTTLRVLGVDDLPEWKITAPREEVIPERVRIQQRMREEELQRLNELKTNHGEVKVGA